MSDVLERFHRTLVEEIRAQRPSYLTGPFTVAEIYQNLVPYGSHRDRIGVEMNGDYEDALLRLLAGEGGYLLLDSEHALRELREELEASNPNTGLYREFAAVDVRLNPAHLGDGATVDAAVAVDDLAPAPTVEEPVGEEPAAPESEPEASPDGTASLWSDATPEAQEEEESRAPVSPEAEDDQGEGTCRWCRAELPAHEHLNFCPFCGTDVHLVPCPGCGEEIQPDWRFCVACGTEVRS